jgi:hypothetical protein
MTALGAHLAAFLREHLPKERSASPHTCEAYATTFQLLVVFASRRLGAARSKRCSTRPIPGPCQERGIEPCCTSPSPPDCGSPN